METPRIQTIDKDGQQVVRLRYPDGKSGQILRPDILADPEKMARYLTDWSVAWAHEQGRTHHDPKPAYDRAKFLRLAEADEFIQAEIDRHRDRGPEEMVLLAIFNTLVLEDSAMLAAYNAS